MLLALFLRYMNVYLLFDGENCRRALGNLINKISKWFWDSINWYQWKCFMGKKRVQFTFHCFFFNLRSSWTTLIWRIFKDFFWWKNFCGHHGSFFFFRFVAKFTFVIFVSLNNYLSEYESLNCQLFKIIHSEKCADVIYRMDLK